MQKCAANIYLYFVLSLKRIIVLNRLQRKKIFRSKPQLVRFLGNAVDLSYFDFRTGKTIAGNTRASRDSATSHTSGKPDLNHLGAGHWSADLFWEKRLKGLRSSDVTEESLRAMDLPRACIGPDPSEDCLLWAIASALHLSSAPISGQSTSAEKNPGVWINASQPPCRSFSVTEQHIREQELVVDRARRSLEEALTADTLARIAQTKRETGVKERRTR
uniref:Methyl-CpG binding protein 2/3 C-terminal domain-containing protein n=1 Tax=Neogobius melanostomus TaxID=47308 RepID=A0A8C6WXS8_9GOBI